MIEISQNIEIKQIMEVINNETGEVSYLIMDDEDNKWHCINQEQYNKIRGKQNDE